MLTKMIENNRVWMATALGWGLLYYLLGFLSLTLDNPDGHLAFVWLPAGVAISAFLLSPRNHWVLLFTSFCIARIVLSFSFPTPLTVSLILTLVSLLNDLVIAWSVRHFSRRHDELYKVVNWIMATILFSGIASLVAVLLLSLQGADPLLENIWIWWSANVTGTIFVTPALVGLFSKRDKSSRVPRWVSVVLVVAVLLVTMITFIRMPDNAQNIALIYCMACIPLILVTITATLCSNRFGSVAFILFSAVVIWASWQETGPFYLARLTAEESIVLAQCYLSGSALLIVFIRAQKNFSAVGAAKSTLWDIAYSLDLQTGALSWNPHAKSSLSLELEQIHSQEQLLAHIPDKTQKIRLQDRWQAVHDNQTVEEDFHFTLQLEGRNPVKMIETRTLILAGTDADAIIGFWAEAPGSLMTPAKEGGR